MNAYEAGSRAFKATRLLDALQSTGVPLGPDVVRGLSAEAWANAEAMAEVRPSSAETRELVAWLSGERARLAVLDPFEGLG